MLQRLDSAIIYKKEAQVPSDVWEQGIDSFNSGDYWQAHEFWEAGWKTLQGPERTYIQALIQFCGALVHLQKGRLGPAQSLSNLALQKLSESPGPHFVVIAKVKDVLVMIQTGTGHEAVNPYLLQVRAVRAN